MTEATLTHRRKAAGETVRRDEIIFDFESEKSVMEYECPAEGVLAEWLVAEGQTVPCGTPVAIIQTGERAAAAPAASPSTQRRRLRPPRRPNGWPGAGDRLGGASGSGPEGRVQLADVEAAAHRTVTPVAERMASELGLDWTQVAGSGPADGCAKPMWPPPRRPR
jgi:pyruvate dehydrogenase E2 component (dihydrolipoamide acetyltransferase)